MKITDLRIGNWICIGNHNTIIGPAYSIKFHDYDFENDGIFKPEIQPILLTEEWLLKFGKIEWLSHDINGYFYWFNKEKKYIKFVHILQNTYFCIEQKELKYETNR